jgi:hypothetical protein
MLKEFRNLTDQEAEILLKAPILVCILIAGADGKIDEKEIKEAIALSKKNKNTNSVLTHYFKEVSEDFEDKMKLLIQVLPQDCYQRNYLIIEELSKLNDIWLKVERHFAHTLYETLRQIAERIASSSGGVLGINAVHEEEARFIDLPMLQDPSKI